MESTSSIALKALRALFRPIARVLLRAGVNWKELAEVCKATYVEIATEDFGLRGRPTNVSRVAILTGFTRREVRRLRKLLEHETPQSFERLNYASRVLSGWFTDSDFTTDNGEPMPLPVAGAAASFESLCDRYSGDVPATTMQKELRHVGAVVEDSEGRLIARTRYYMPVHMDPQQMLRSGSVLADIGTTVAYNLHRRPGDPSRFERRAHNTNIPERAIPAFRQFIEQEGQAFLEKVDAWLTDHDDNSSEGSRVRLGIGAYWIEEESTPRIVS